MPEPMGLGRGGRRIGAGSVRAMIFLLFLIHVCLSAWLLADEHTLHFLVFRIFEVEDPELIDAPPEMLKQFGYVQDAPEDLRGLMARTRFLGPFATDDLSSLRDVADFIYAFRRPGRAEHANALQLSNLFDQIRGGNPAFCGDMSRAMAAVLRGLGYDTRRVIWFDASGDKSHAGLEIYSVGRGQWVYYAVNVNGYITDEADQPQSFSMIRERFARGLPLFFHRNRDVFMDAESDFLSRLRVQPLYWYVMNNRYLYFEEDRRFGMLNSLRVIFALLPSPVARGLDNLVGMRETRMSVSGVVVTDEHLGVRSLRWLAIYLGVAFVGMLAALWSTRSRGRPGSPWRSDCSTWPPQWRESTGPER